jgi:23S rRNA A2030 N6-methylase RlmJ
VSIYRNTLSKVFNAKNAALTAIDPPAGAGLHQFDGDRTASGSEAKRGALKPFLHQIGL